MRTIVWLLPGAPERPAVVFTDSSTNRDSEGEFENGLSEGGASFSAARIGHLGVTMKTRKEAILNMHKVLIKRRDALRKALAGDLSLLKELRAQSGGDVVDAALDSVQDEISSQLAEVESRELARIENALARMREGEYGVCEACACNIPTARLNALPYATLCIRCQREAEREAGSSRADVDWGRLLDVSSQDVDLSINDIELDVS